MIVNGPAKRVRAKRLRVEASGKVDHCPLLNRNATELVNGSRDVILERNYALDKP